MVVGQRGALALLLTALTGCGTGAGPTDRPRNKEAEAAKTTFVNSSTALADAAPSSCMTLSSYLDYLTNGVTVVSGPPGWWCCPAGVGACAQYPVDAGADERVAQDRREGIGRMTACPADGAGNLLPGAAPPTDATPAGSRAGATHPYAGKAGSTNVDWVGHNQIFCAF
jgi:hypothetical protein